MFILFLFFFIALLAFKTKVIDAIQTTFVGVAGGSVLFAALVSKNIISASLVNLTMFSLLIVATYRVIVRIVRSIK